MKQIEITVRLNEDKQTAMKKLSELGYKVIRQSDVDDIYMTTKLDELNADNIQYVLKKSILLRKLTVNNTEIKKITYKNKEIKDSKSNENVYVFDMPSEIKNARMKDIYIDDKNRKQIITWLTKFIHEYDSKKKIKGLYLNGNFGCGKTYLISATFNELSKRGIKSAIIYWPEFLRSLKESFSDDFKEKFNYIKKVPLLLIDDIGAENVTLWGRDEILGTILQYRMEEGLTTFFTSNLTYEELESALSLSKGKVDSLKATRIMERIKNLTVNMNLIGENRRN